MLTYIDDDNDEELKAYKQETGQQFGQGQLDIDNDFIAGRQTIYTAPFSPMINILSFQNQIYIPQIRWLDASGAKEVDPKPKIGLIETGLDLDLLTYGGSSTMTYGDNAGQSTIPFCWFVKTEYTTETDAFDMSLAFDQVAFPNASGEPLKQYLEDYEKILNSPKYLKAYLHLTEIDINELNFTIPVYIEHYKAYFYISKINNYQGSRKVTECELVKIG